MRYVINGQVALSRPPEGPIATHIASFARWVNDQGYAIASLYRRVLLAACFSLWLQENGVRLRNVSSEHAIRYLRYRARRVRPGRGDPTALKQLIEFLRQQGEIPAEKKRTVRGTPAEECAQEFERYLREERALSNATILNYVPFVRRFFNDTFGNGRVALRRLCADDVVRFVQHQAPRLHLKRAKLMTTALRSFFQYARYRGDITLDLAAAVPAVANWSMAGIPRAIPADQVKRLLASINRRTAMGRRDYAILLLLARLGLLPVKWPFSNSTILTGNRGALACAVKGAVAPTCPCPPTLVKRSLRICVAVDCAAKAAAYFYAPELDVGNTSTRRHAAEGTVGPE